MDAKKCDRCKNYYDPVPYYKIKVLVDNHPYGEAKKDLCPECCDKFFRFLNGEELEGECHGT